MNFRSHPLTRLEHYFPSRLFLLLTAASLLLLLVLQLANLTIRQNDHYQEQARNNLFTRKRLSAPRGNIFDRHGVVLATNKRTYSVSFSPYGMNNEEASESLAKLRTIFSVPSELDAEAIIATRPRWTRHDLVRRAEHHEVIALLERPAEFPGVRVHDDFKREYTQPTDFALILGHMGKIQKGETETYARPRYLPDDEVGRSGLERALQDELTGHPGFERYQRNARGRYLDAPDVLEETKAGKNVYLTLDAKLQAQAMELLRHETGTIILMDVRSGEVLIMASTPTYDASQPGATEVDGRKPGYVNRAIRGLFSPGSPFKVVGAAALLRSETTLAKTHHCNGGFHIAGWDRPFWCNVRTGHGPTTLAQSLQWSCNTFYYELGKLLGPEPLLEMANAFGFGGSTSVDLPGERTGSLPGLNDLKPGELTNFTIGQGRLLATPLQVVRSFAGLANGGVLPTPRLVAAVGYSPTEGKTEPGAGQRIGIPPSHIEAIVAGLHGVVNDPTGTAYKAGIPPRWDVVGKTGTAENPTGGVDAWFTGFFPRAEPKYAFVVHIESADGHGGAVAGPIGRAIIGAVLGETEALDVAADF